MHELFKSVNGHSPVGGSSMSRVLRCPGSVRMAHGKHDKPSSYAEEGTRAHEAAEVALECYFRGTGYDRVRSEYGVEIADNADQYVQYICREILGGLPNNAALRRCYVEHPVDYSHLIPNGVGTADFVYVNDDELHVVDYKYGKGVPVSPIENEQLLSYLSGANREFSLVYDYEKMFVHIVQPRIDVFASWEVSKETLAEFELRVKVAADLITSDKPVLKAGDHCRWCPASGDCPEQMRTVYSSVVGDFEDTSRPKNLSDQELKKLADDIPAIETFLAKAKEEIFTRTSNGELPGYKLVRGRKGARTWVADDAVIAGSLVNAGVVSEEQVEDFFVVTRSFLSPAAMEKKLGKQTKIPEALITQADGRLMYAPESDPRPAETSVKPEDDFDSLD